VVSEEQIMMLQDQANLSVRVGSIRAVAQHHRLPFDRLRASGGVLKSFDFSVRAELVEA